jgi:transmembrane sensor
MNDIDHIITSVLNQEASHEELTQLEDWVNISPENDQTFRRLLDLWYENQQQKPVHQIGKRVLEKLGDNDDNQPITSSEKKRRPFFFRFKFQLVAIFLVLFSAVSLWGFFRFFPEKITLKTAYGEQKEILLPDSTEIILNANSQITFRRNFSREVWLEGEAFFSVSPRYESREIFWVHTKDLSVKVLGTTFNVNSFQEKTQVYLEEGKIKLNLQGETLIEKEVLLSPGELLIYSAKSGGKFNKKLSQAKTHTSWKDGAAILENVPLGEILTRMQEIYGVKFKVKNENFLKHRYTIAIPTENLDISVEALKSILRSDTIIRKDNVFIID